MTTNKVEDAFQQVSVKPETILRKKEFYEFTTPDNVFDIELYQNQDGTCYAIGIPREGEKLIVYGTNVVSGTAQALTQLIHKIERQGFDREFPPGLE